MERLPPSPMTTKGRPRTVLPGSALRTTAAPGPRSLLLRQRRDDLHPSVFGPILSLWAPPAGDTSQRPCRPAADQLDLRWTGGGAGGAAALFIAPPGGALPSGPAEWRLRLPLEQVLLAAQRLGGALALPLSGSQPQPLAAASLLAAIADLVGHACAGDAAAWLAEEPLLIDQLVTVLLASPPSGWQRRCDRGWQHVILTVSRMAEGVGEDLNLADLSQTTGVSPRALQLAFRRHLGKRPLQSLRELRLARLRTLLLAGECSQGLAFALKRCGLPGNGTTARHYQERFGEKPSQTRA